MHDPTLLPPDLPPPVDDGAADHLVGSPIPGAVLQSTAGGSVDLRDLAAGRLVLYVYPRMGPPHESIPAGWDETPGARGCTPQSCAFRDRHEAFGEIGYTVAGLSGQLAEEQKEASARLHLPFHLLADPSLGLSTSLGLPTFEFDGATFYKRLTLVARDRHIVKVFYPVFPPDENAEEVLEWIRGEASP